MRPELRRPPDIEAQRQDEFLVVYSARRALRRDEAVYRCRRKARVAESRGERLSLQPERALRQVESERVARADADDARVRWSHDGGYCTLRRQSPRASGPRVFAATWIAGPNRKANASAGRTVRNR